MSNRNQKAGSYTNNGWGLCAFTDDDLVTIHHASLELFQDVGVKIENEKAAEIYLSSGCKVEKKGGYWIALEIKYLNERACAAAKRRIKTHVPKPVTEDIKKEVGEIIAEYLVEAGVVKKSVK